MKILQIKKKKIIKNALIEMGADIGKIDEIISESEVRSVSGRCPQNRSIQNMGPGLLYE